jgi:hypothetical protein
MVFWHGYTFWDELIFFVAIRIVPIFRQNRTNNDVYAGNVKSICVRFFPAR